MKLHSVAEVLSEKGWSEVEAHGLSIRGEYMVRVSRPEGGPRIRVEVPRSLLEDGSLPSLLRYLRMWDHNPINGDTALELAEDGLRTIDWEYRRSQAKSPENSLLETENG